MTSQQIGFLTMQGMASAAVLTAIGVYALQAHEEKTKFKLFAVRDKFLYLAATGVLDKNGLVFAVFYGAINTFIANLDKQTLVSFIRASLAVKTELEKQNRERLLTELEESPPEVQTTIKAFVQVVMEALQYNSPTLSLILLTARHCTHLFMFLKRHLAFKIQIYTIYRYYENFYGATNSTPARHRLQPV